MESKENPDAVLQDKRFYEIAGVEFERPMDRSFIGVGPKDYDPDKRLWREICYALTFDPQIDASDIEVDVKNGVVTLSGLVQNRKIKKMVQKCVENFNQVKDIHNLLKFRSGSFFWNEFDETDTY